MKKLKYFFSVMLAVSLLAIPATAQRRSNKGRANLGDNRADLVHWENKKKDKDKDKDKDRDPDNDKNKGKHKGEHKGKHKGHRH